MSEAWREIAKRCVPAAVRRWARAKFGWRWLRGDYANWAEACAAVAAAQEEGKAELKRGGREERGGRAEERGVGRIVAAARAVRAGRAVWERDGVLFEKAEVHAPLLAALRRAAASAGGRLAVVDFGGALGSTWWQHRAEFVGLEVDWRVVELPGLVEAGREFAGDGLSFHASLDAAEADGRPTVILFSSVLQYLEDPWAMLAEAARRRVRHVIVDRAGFVAGARDRLVMQHTRPEFGGARMPCWLFARERLEAALGGDYQRVDEWTETFDALDESVTYRGMHFVR